MQQDGILNLWKVGYLLGKSCKAICNYFWSISALTTTGATYSPPPASQQGNNTYVPETPCIQFFGAKVANKPLVQQILGMSVLISDCCFRPQKGRHRGRQPLPSIIQSPCPYGKSDFQGISKDQNISLPAVFCFCSLGEPNIKNQLYAQRKFKSHMPRKTHRLGKIRK